MAFSHTKIYTVQGNKRVMEGTYTNTSSSAGGDIETGFTVVESCFLQPKGSSILANQPVVNEDFPLRNTGGKVTIVTNENEVGSFRCSGY